MDSETLMELARQLLSGGVTPDSFLRSISAAGIANLGDAQLDVDRQRRCGYPEIVYCPGKSTESLARIFDELHSRKIEVLATRATPEQYAALAARFPELKYNLIGRTLRLPHPECKVARHGRVAIITAGTSDLPVAEEARETADWMGAETAMVVDVGVAGPHRLPARLSELRGADAIVVVAGMEGALPSVVGGYVDCPVIAVPTSVGYGASFGGVAALLSMLNSCATNVTVVNIDAGLKAGFVAGLIARRAGRESRP